VEHLIGPVKLPDGLDGAAMGQSPDAVLAPYKKGRGSQVLSSPVSITTKKSLWF